MEGLVLLVELGGGGGELLDGDVQVVLHVLHLLLQVAHVLLGLLRPPVGLLRLGVQLLGPGQRVVRLGLQALHLLLDGVHLGFLAWRLGGLLDDEVCFTQAARCLEARGLEFN